MDDKTTIKNLIRKELLNNSIPFQSGNKIIIPLEWCYLTDSEKIFLDEFNPCKEDIEFYGSDYCYAVIVLDERFLSENVIHLFTMSVRCPDDMIGGLIDNIPLEDLHISNSEKIEIINRLQKLD